MNLKESDMMLGDILLVRQKKDPISEQQEKQVHAFWREALLYLGDGKIAEVNLRGSAIHPFSNYANSSFLNIGVFRLKEKLTDEQQQKIVDIARKKLGLYKGWLGRVVDFFLDLFDGKKDNDFHVPNNLKMPSSEFIASVYESADVRLNHFPPHQFSLYDIDESKKTVRIL